MMKSSLAHKASITLPEKLAKALRQRARRENRTLSGVLQEAARYYLDMKQYEELQQEMALKAPRLGLQSDDDVDEMIHAQRR